MLGNIHCDFQSVHELEELRAQFEARTVTGVSSTGTHAVFHYDTDVSPAVSPLWQTVEPEVTPVHEFLGSRVSPAAASEAVATDRQIGGDHYKSLKIQPIEYIDANNMPYLEGNVVKYVTRHASKNGVQDIDKAIHYLELIKQMRYAEDTTSDK